MTGSGNWTYLIPGSSPVLVDAGVGKPSHVDAVLSQVPDGPATVVVTHAHSDHASGAPALAARAPAARFLKYPWPERDAAVPVEWQRLRDGDVVESGEGPLVVVHTPGHSPDHLALWHAESRTALTGDLLVLGSTVVIPASHGGVLTDYLASLHRIAALRPARALPAHGPAIEDPLALITSYLAHRDARERQVLEALATGSATVAAIVDRIYQRLDAALVPMARESILAHLVRLAGDGRVTERDGMWTLVR